MDLRTSIAVLGDTKVITRDQAHIAFNQPESNDQVMIRYFEDTVRKCAVMNRKGADWRLLYGLPLSFRDQHDIIGVDRDNQPCFNDAYEDWWLSDKEAVWAKSQPEAGYVLIDMKGRFNRTNWNDQNTRISEMGDAYERADERVLSQALISTFKTHGQRLHEVTYHWGRIEDSDGFRVCVGGFSSGGLGVNDVRPSGGFGGLFACVSHKFDF